MFNLPTLFKENRQWSIWAEDHNDYASYTSEFGQVNGKLQRTTVEVYEGKNLNKSNETNCFEQACLEAKSLWEKKRDKNYKEVLEDNSSLLDLRPMLAKSYQKEKKKFKLIDQWYSQPKLDGLR
ncbi:MAG: hypothetical protein AABY22_26860, partial [Nanoarchaeota archaeon]